MIIERLKQKWAIARNEREKRRVTEQLEREQAIEKEATEWRETYFVGIIFPIVILTKKDYLAVSTLAEYYIDPDINIWFIESDHELIDSTGQKYDFQQIEGGQWVPHEKTGTISYEDLKSRILPLLYMPKHKKEINATKNIKELIDLILTE